MTRASRIAWLFSYAVLAFLTLSLALELAVRVTPLVQTSEAQRRSRLVAASDGKILWGFLAADEKWRLSIAEADVDPQYLSMLIAYEDQRFRNHRGIDAAALIRAALQTLRHGRALSGGSTLTMQVVRLLEPKPRSLVAKLDQIFKAIKLERSATKDEILNLYLTLAPFGGNIEGIRATSLQYFGKEPRHLSLSEAALLVALPQAPEQRRPDIHVDAARTGRDRILAALSRRQVVDGKRATLAMREPVSAAGRSFLNSAPHLAMLLRRTAALDDGEITPTLIDSEFQQQVELIAAHAIKSWDSAVNIAILVLRNRDSSVAAYVGGVDLSVERRGFVDLVQAVRSPGSTLKPFIYGMAFEKLIVHPDTIVTDQPIEVAGYSPENADGRFSGDLTIRQALIRSRNTTAVLLLDQLGADALLGRFRSAGRPLHLPTSDSRAGLAIALGGVGVSLEQLTWFYTVFPNGGILHALRYRPSDPALTLGPFMAPTAARAVADILADVPAPPGYARQLSAGGGRRIGFKTGTSYGFRDAWAIGFDRLHTIGVWVGRADGAAHFGSYGATAAAPILMQVFERLPVPHDDVGFDGTGLGALTSYRDLPQRLIRFTGSADDDRGYLRIAFPGDGSTVQVDRSADGAANLPLTAVGGTPPYFWTLSGAVQPPSPLTVYNWSVTGRGQFEISVMDASGKMATSSFWLD